jgi:hypothetical protein
MSLVARQLVRLSWEKASPIKSQKLPACSL